MLFQTFRERSDLPFEVLTQQDPSDGGHDGRRFCEEKSWRCLAENDRVSHAGVLVSRWIETSDACRHEKTAASSNWYVIGVALKAARVKLTRGSSTVFDGSMPAGTLHITGPDQPLTAEFRGPCDFVHFHVSSDYMRECQEAARSSRAEQICDLNDLIIRDSLAELLGKTLVEQGTEGDVVYLESIAQTLVMHVARLEPPRHTVKALPKWRMKHVQEYVATHLEDCIGLADLAKVAGLSRMHFAAQFRAATGLRPHDYVLQQRVASAIDILSNTDMPLAEVALAVGFYAQPHFSTVFKRLVDETPARWRKSHRACNTPPGGARMRYQPTQRDRATA